MRTIIAGSRIGPSMEMLESAMSECGWIPTTVISGAARGADRLGEVWASAHNIPVERYCAQWGIHGRSAGHIRNVLMADRAAALVALWDGYSRGTKNMIETAKRKGLRVFIYRFEALP